MSTRALALSSCLALTACAAPGSGAADAVEPLAVDEPALVVPWFDAADERPNTGGFVRTATRDAVEQGPHTFSLLAFAVGDTVTLGAMVRGGFHGSAEFELGDQRFAVPFADEPKSGDVPAVRPDGTVFATGQKAGFRDFAWVNIDLPRDAWPVDAAQRLRLSFYEAATEPVATLPDEAVAWRASLVRQELQASSEPQDPAAPQQGHARQ